MYIEIAHIKQFKVYISLQQIILSFRLIEKDCSLDEGILE